MSAKANANARFRFTATFGANAVGVDREADALRGVVIMQTGETREVDDRKLFVDRTTQEQYVALASAANGKLRGRYTHGDATDEGLGTYLGRWGNFRIDGENVRQDLVLSPRSHESPKGDLGKYVLDMAETDPDMLGASMMVKFDFAAMRKERRADGFMPIRLKAVFGADIVDTPALASGMFAADQSEGDDDMSDSFTKEQFEAGLKAGLESLGQSLTDSILAKVDERFAAKFAAQKASDDPTPEQLRIEGARLASQIMAFAATSGLNDHAKLAQEAIDAGQSVETFKAGLADRLVAQNKMSNDGSDTNPDDPHAKFRAEFKAGREAFATVGVVDEEAYVRSRCRDEGLPVPEIKKAS